MEGSAFRIESGPDGKVVGVYLNGRKIHGVQAVRFESDIDVDVGVPTVWLRVLAFGGVEVGQVAEGEG